MEDWYSNGETDAQITERLRNMVRDGETQPPVSVPERTDYLSGIMQSALALGTSYVSRRMDIDLQSRIVGSQPQVQRLTNQRPVADHADLVGNAPAPTSRFGLADLLPWLLIGGAGWFIYKNA